MTAIFSFKDFRKILILLLSFIFTIFEESYIQALLLIKNIFHTGMENIDT